MIAGSTVTVLLTDLPLPLSRMAKVNVVYRDAVSRDVRLEKTLEDMRMQGETLRYTLSQEESLALEGRLMCSVVFCTNDGIRGESVPMLLEVMPSAIEEVLL